MIVLLLKKQFFVRYRSLCVCVFCSKGSMLTNREHYNPTAFSKSLSRGQGKPTMLEKATKLEPQQLRFIISQSHQLHGIGTFFPEVVHSVSHRITHKAHHLAVGMGGDQVKITMEKEESKSGIRWKMKHLAGEGFNVTRALSLSLSLLGHLLPPHSSSPQHLGFS